YIIGGLSFSAPKDRLNRLKLLCDKLGKFLAVLVDNRVAQVIQLFDIVLVFRNLLDQISEIVHNLLVSTCFEGVAAGGAPLSVNPQLQEGGGVRHKITALGGADTDNHNL